jgi:hypothetical protein
MAEGIGAGPFFCTIRHVLFHKVHVRTNEEKDRDEETYGSATGPPEEKKLFLKTRTDMLYFVSNIKTIT